MKMSPSLLVAALSLVLAGCGRNVKSTTAFHLPPGDAELGRVAFLALKCHACHTVKGVELPAPVIAPENVIALGGEVVRSRTYGDLLSAIVHPNDRLSDKMPPALRVRTEKSPMPAVNEVMTVAQLVNLIAFLQPKYDVVHPPVDHQY